MKDLLIAHLTALTENQKIKLWQDRFIRPGEDWDAAIKSKLAESEIILFLTSSKSISSKYVKEVEMKTAFERHRAGDLIIIPVIVGHVHLGKLPISKYQTLPTNGECVLDFDKGVDFAFKTLAREFEEFLDNLFNPDGDESRGEISSNSSLTLEDENRSEQSENLSNRSPEQKIKAMLKHYFDDNNFPRPLKNSNHLRSYLTLQSAHFEHIEDELRRIDPRSDEFVRPIKTLMREVRESCQQIQELISDHNTEYGSLERTINMAIKCAETLEAHLFDLVNNSSERLKISMKRNHIVPLANHLALLRKKMGEFPAGQVDPKNN